MSFISKSINSYLHDHKLSVNNIDNKEKRNILQNEIIDEINDAKKKYQENFEGNYESKNEKKNRNT